MSEIRNVSDNENKQSLLYLFYLSSPSLKDNFLPKYFRIVHTNPNYAPTGLSTLEVLISASTKCREFRGFQVNHEILYKRNLIFLVSATFSSCKFIRTLQKF